MERVLHSGGLLMGLLAASRGGYCVAVKRRIKPLSAVMAERKGNQIRELFESNSERVFEFGMDPVEFKLHYFIFFKYSFWQSNDFARARLLAFIAHCDRLEQQQQAGQLIRQYRKQIAIEILPSVISEFAYVDIYLEQLRRYLEGVQELDEIEVHFIILNFHRIVHGTEQLQYFNNRNDNAWTISHALSLFLDRCAPRLGQLPATLKGRLIDVARSLKVEHVQFLEFLKRDLQKDKKEISLQVFLAALLYLGYHNSFPHEYFYRNKDSLMSFIESAEDLSEKKVTVSIYMLEIFARNRLPYCEKILDRLLVCIRQNLMASDVTQLARIFYYYSRLRCGTDHDFVLSIVERIYAFLDSLDERHYLLIVKAVANLNYHDETLTRSLKAYNYELFLTSLKFGCEQLGSYYQAILDEVERSFTRHYSHDDKPFQELPANN